jgi:hypothetical protein
MKIVCSVFIFFSLSMVSPSEVQILSAKVGVNGLTCSICTRSVEMGLRRLDFVDSVVMSLENTDGEIYFRKDYPVNLEQLAKAIVNAGFSVRFVKIQFDLNHIELQETGSFVFQGQDFIWLDYKKTSGKEAVWLTLVGDAFLPKSEMKNWKSKMQNSSSDSKRGVYYVSSEG